MNEIIILPPGPEPKKVTANYRPKNLHEQLMAFLNCNNPKDFADDPEYKYEPPSFEYPEDSKTLVDVLLSKADYPFLTISLFKSYCRQIKKCTGRRKISSGKERKLIYDADISLFGIRQRDANHLAAVVFGYKSYNEATGILGTVEVTGNKVIINKRKPGEFKNQFFPDL